MSKLGIQHVQDNYNFEDYEQRWVETMDKIVEKYGSWDNKDDYKRWYLMEIT